MLTVLGLVTLPQALDSVPTNVVRWKAWLRWFVDAFSEQAESLQGNAGRWTLVIVGLTFLFVASGLPEQAWTRYVRRNGRPVGPHAEGNPSLAEQVLAHGRRTHDPYGAELHRLLPLLVTEIQQQMGGPRTNQPARYYLDAVMAHIRDHRREGEYRELIETLQELSNAFGRVVSWRPPVASPNRIFGMLAPGYERQAQAALDVIRRIIGNV